MDNRGIILFGFGFLVGYMVIRATRNNIVVAPENQSLPDVSSQTEPPATAGAVSGTTQIKEPEVVEVVENPKIEACKEKWIKFAETRKFASAEQEQKTYDNFMTSFVAQS